jgi:6-phosphogluconolactonase
MRSLIIALACFSAILCLGGFAAAEPVLLYIGTYSDGKDGGIEAFRFDTTTGEASPLGVAAKMKSPSFLAASASGRFLYAVGEVDDFGQKGAGIVAALSVDASTGRLTLLNQVSSRGAHPCHVVVDRSGKYVLVANYTGGNVAALPIQPDGRLGEATGFAQHQGKSVNPQRQEAPHAHSINVSPDGRFAVAADLGLDQLLVYRLDPAHGTLTPNDPPFTKSAPGAGPRHFTFHPGAAFAYAINELDSTVTTYAWDIAKGRLDPRQTITTLPEGGVPGNTTAEVQVHPSGRFLYGSNRGHDSIAIFAIDPKTGELRFVSHQPTQGKTPRNFGIAPGGRFLLAANQDSGTIVVFRIDPDSGKLTPTGTVLQVKTPVCVRFVTTK